MTEMEGMKDEISGLREKNLKLLNEKSALTSRVLSPAIIPIAMDTIAPVSDKSFEVVPDTASFEFKEKEHLLKIDNLTHLLGETQSLLDTLTLEVNVYLLGF